jgi:hypothetical protein
MDISNHYLITPTHFIHLQLHRHSLIFISTP